MIKHVLNFIMRDNLNSDRPYFVKQSPNKYLVFNYIAKKVVYGINISI